jgi:TolB-like protein
MSLFAELKRRNVIRVAIAYAIVAWVTAQVAEFAFENFGAPDWVLKSVVVVLLLGLPLAVFFAWAFELTPEGIKREKEVDRSQSIVAQTGRKLDRMIIGVLVIALAWFAWDKFLAGGTSEPASDTSETPAIAAALQDKSVAVLPFVAMSSGPDDEYFADGLTEEILNSLAQLPELLVTARTSAFSFKGPDVPIQQIATALGVQHVVEGSVRRAGERLRVTAQLIRAQDGFHLWSENYDSNSTDTISMQENIAEQIAAALNVVLDEKKRAAMRDAGLRDVEAFTLYQKGLEVYERAHGESDTTESLRKANAYFEQVMARVPDFAQVYIDHSDLYIHMLSDDASGLHLTAVTDEEVATAYATAIADYEAAGRYAQSDDMRLMIDLDLAFISGNWRGMGLKLERALTSQGCTDSNWIQVLSIAFDYAEPYLERSRRVLACDPRRSLSWFNSSRTALHAGDRTESLRLAREGTQIAPGEWLSTALIRALMAHGEYEQARKEIANRITDRVVVLVSRAQVSALEGNRARFEEEFAEYRREYPADAYWALALGAVGGDRERANLEAAKIDQHPFGAITLTLITSWCGCGAPFDLDAAPNFAARIRDGGPDWPPPAALVYPLKDW